MSVLKAIVARTTRRERSPHHRFVNGTVTDVVPHSTVPVPHETMCDDVSCGDRN